MKKNILGRTGLLVSELCFGVLPLGPLQLNMPVEEGADLIRKGLEEGINFLDTAESYRTYPHIARALKGYDGEVIIATKSPACTFKEMENSVQKALKELNRDVIDIFLLHGVRDRHLFSEREGAYDCLREYKAKGLVRFIGVSSHSVEGVEKAAEEEGIDVIFPLINKLGRGIEHGDLTGMRQAIEKARLAGKGLYAMKALAGGHLIREAEEAINYVREIEGIASTAIGMVSQGELEMNLRIIRDLPVPQEMKASNMKSKKLFIAPYCKGCGNCVKTCLNGALSIKEGRATVDRNKCVLCGYCNPICPEFAIRIV